MVADAFAGFDEVSDRVRGAHVSRNGEHPLTNTQQGAETLSATTH